MAAAQTMAGEGLLFSSLSPFPSLSVYDYGDENGKRLGKSRLS